MNIFRMRSFVTAVAMLALAMGCADKPAPPSNQGGMPDAPAGAGTVPSLDDVASQVGKISTAGLTFTVPSGWVAQKPSSMMRLAQYQLPGSAGPAELAIFAFGPGQGGEVQANIDRWVGQFSGPDGQTPSQTKQVEKNGLKLWLITASGTYTPTAMGPMVPAADPKENQALYGVIIEGGSQGRVFLKATGPKATIDSQSAALRSFAESVQKAS